MERLLLRFCCSSDGSLRFWPRDSKAVVLNSFRFTTMWKDRSCLSLSRSLSLTWLLFFSFGVLWQLKTLMFSFIGFECNVFFDTVVAQVMKFLILARDCKAVVLVLFVVLKQIQYTFRFVLGFHVLIFSLFFSLSIYLFFSIVSGCFLASAYMGSSILMFFSLIFWWSVFSALRLFKCWKLAILIPWQ